MENKIVVNENINFEILYQFTDADIEDDPYTYNIEVNSKKEAYKEFERILEECKDADDLYIIGYEMTISYDRYEYGNVRMYYFESRSVEEYLEWKEDKEDD